MPNRQSERNSLVALPSGGAVYASSDDGASYYQIFDADTEVWRFAASPLTSSIDDTQSVLSHRGTIISTDTWSFTGPYMRIYEYHPQTEELVFVGTD